MIDLFDFEKKEEYSYPQTMVEVDQMSGKEFEKFIFNFLKDHSDYTVRFTETYDYGIDIIATKDETRYGIQCKRYGPNTVLEETQLIKMYTGVDHYGISKSPEDNKPILIVYTTATESQVSQRARDFIENNSIKMYYRDAIIEILKVVNKDNDHNTSDKNYENIAYDTTRRSKGSFKQNSKMVEMLKEERKKIAKFNKIHPLYLVYNDKTIAEIIKHKPTKIEDLSNVKGLSNKNIKLFGNYLIKRLHAFYQYEMPELYDAKIETTDAQPKEKEVVEASTNHTNEQLIDYLKKLRIRIANYNDIPIYMVFSNDALEEIANNKPKTVEELKQIKGFGDKKCELFGEYLINNLNKYFNSN